MRQSEKIRDQLGLQTLVPWLALLLAVPHATVKAQAVAQYGAHTMMSSGNGAQCRSPVSLATRGEWRGGSVTVLPGPVSSDTRYGVATPIVALGARTSDSRAWRAEVSGAIGHAESDCATLSEWPRAYAQLSRNIANGSIGVSYGYNSLSSLDPSRDRQGFMVTAVQRIRGSSLTLDVRAHDASTYSSRILKTPVWKGGLDTRADTGQTVNGHWDTTKTTLRSRITNKAFDLRTRLQLSAGRFAFDVSGGSSIGRGTIPVDTTRLSQNGSKANALRVKLWTRVDARTALTPWLDVLGGFAVLPVKPTFDAPTRGVVSLGFGISRWSRSQAAAAASDNKTNAAFEIVRDDSTRVRFRFRVARAADVQLSGEPTQWQPVTMNKSQDGWWETTVVATPGTYRMNLRVDGAAWQPPPGVPSVRDEFGGHVGLVTVK